MIRTTYNETITGKKIFEVHFEYLVRPRSNLKSLRRRVYGLYCSPFWLQFWRALQLTIFPIQSMLCTSRVKGEEVSTNSCYTWKGAIPDCRFRVPVLFGAS